MKWNGLSLILLLSVLGLGGWAALEFGHRTELEAKLAAVTQERDVLRVTANKKLSLGSKTEVKADGPEGLGEEHAKALEEELKSQNKKQSKDGVTQELDGDEKNPMSAMSDMMKDPAMKEMIKTQMRSQLEFTYRDLFDLLEMDLEKQEKLTKMLTERAGVGMELGFEMMYGKKPSDEEKKKKLAEVKVAREASDTAIKDLLGEADYAKFASFENSQPERQQLSSLNSQLKEKGIALSEETESKLMDVMYKERSHFKYDVDLGNEKNVDMDLFTEQNLTRYQEQQAALRKNIEAKVVEILTPDQMEIFRKNQEQQSAMEKMGMEMAAKMLGEKKKQTQE